MKKNKRKLRSHFSIQDQPNCDHHWPSQCCRRGSDYAAGRVCESSGPCPTQLANYKWSDPVELGLAVRGSSGESNSMPNNPSQVGNTLHQWNTMQRDQATRSIDSRCQWQTNCSLTGSGASARISRIQWTFLIWLILLGQYITAAYGKCTKRATASFSGTPAFSIQIDLLNN